MALFNCPECLKEISTDAGICPHCGYKINRERDIDFTPIIKPLNKTKITGRGKTLALVIGSIIFIAAGIPMITIGVGVVLIILGIIGFFSAFTEVKKYKFGECPYCNTELKVNAESQFVICPVCSKKSRVTETTLESIQAADNSSENNAQ